MEKKTENKLNKLKAEVNELNKQISDIEYKELKEVSIPELRKSLGRCFKYHNTYGGENKRWWLYKKIIGLNEKNMSYTTIEFQETSIGLIEIKNEQHYNFQGKSYFDNQGTWYTEIKPSEYEKAKRLMIKRLEKLLN